jgi:hypothetical protein
MQPMYAQESPAFEKVRRGSPDWKFARAFCVAADLITAVELVSRALKTGRLQIMRRSETAATEDNRERKTFHQRIVHL